MDTNNSPLIYNGFREAFEQFLESEQLLSKIEKMAQAGKKTLILSVDGHSELQNRKIRFVDSSYPTALTTILNSHHKVTEEDTKKQLINLLRDQIQKGQFIFESKLSDGTIQAITSPLIATKLEKGELKLISNKDHTTERKYDSIEQLDAKQLEELTSLVSHLDKPSEMNQPTSQQNSETNSLDAPTDTEITQQTNEMNTPLDNPTTENSSLTQASKVDNEPLKEPVDKQSEDFT